MTTVGAAEPARPNVLIILADDLGFSDPGCYGGEIATPNLDALAKNGLRFTQFYNTARCWPSRAAILTGYYAQQVRRDTVPGVKSGSQGTRPAWARLLPEMLKPLGYRSYHSGKWHVDGKPLAERLRPLVQPQRPRPPLRPAAAHRGRQAAAAGRRRRAATTPRTAIADHAIKCLKEHAEKYADKPFFEYLAFTAPHFPLQAPPEDIARYRKTYLRRLGRDARRALEAAAGTEASAARRCPPIERDVGPPYAFPDAIKKLGPDEVNRPLPWEDLTAEQREFQADKMAIHAAMVDRMDREIGRVLDQLKAMGALDNTLILFLSDNGASAEIMVRGDGHDPHAECGTGGDVPLPRPRLVEPGATRRSAGTRPGSTRAASRTPLIVHWPKGIAARGELRHTPGHVIDLVPTILEAGRRQAPETVGRQAGAAAAGQEPRAGCSRRTARSTHDYLWWLHEGNRALRVGDWKIVAAGKDSPWELYDLNARSLGDEEPGQGEAREGPRDWRRCGRSNSRNTRPWR